MLDYNAPWKLEPQAWHRPWVGYHPHRGFETVTIVYSGEVEHHDTAGHGGIIWGDEIQWMTAGSGLLHNEYMTERFSAMGGIQHAVQLWVNLPQEHKMTTPRYQALTKGNIPEVTFDWGKVRVIAGELKVKFSSRHSEERRIQVPETLDPSTLSQDDEMRVQRWVAKTFSPVELYDVRFDPMDSTWDGADSSLHSEWQIPKKSRITFTFPEGYNTMILVTEWSIIANGKTLENGDMLYFSREGTEITLEYASPRKNPQSSTSSDSSFTKGASVLVMAGKPLDEPVASYWPFVMNTQSEIMQAFQDLRDGKMGEVRG